MKYCIKCGVRLIDGANYCANCGAPTEKTNKSELHKKAKNSNNSALIGFGALASLLFFPVAVVFELAKKYK